MKVGLDVRIPLISLFYLLGDGEKLPPKRLTPFFLHLCSSPPKKKVFPEENLKAVSNDDLFDDDIKESLKATNVQKCNFSQS